MSMCFITSPASKVRRVILARFSLLTDDEYGGKWKGKRRRWVKGSERLCVGGIVSTIAASTVLRVAVATATLLPDYHFCPPLAAVNQPNQASEHLPIMPSRHAQAIKVYSNPC